FYDRSEVKEMLIQPKPRSQQRHHIYSVSSLAVKSLITSADKITDKRMKIITLQLSTQLIVLKVVG
ncbi:hypothetical protein TNCV_2221051, partial [Trichonephila clavipes]